jgi:hypothetical protein
MTIRRDPIYLSTEVSRALWILAHARSPEDGSRIMTADEMADTILREAITQKYPQLLEHQKRITKMEAELVKSLGGSA